MAKQPTPAEIGTADTAAKRPLPDPPELAAAKAQRALLAEEAGIAENRKKIIDAALPGKVEALQGEAKIEGEKPIEAQILAYKALDHLAAQIADQIATLQPRPTRIAIHSEAEINSVFAYRAFLQQLEVIKTQIDEETSQAEWLLEPKAGAEYLQRFPKLALDKSVDLSKFGIETFTGPLFGGAPVALAGAAIRSAIDLVSLFRTDVSLKYNDLKIEDRALIAAVSGKLAAQPIEVYDPDLMPPRLPDEQSNVRTRLGEVEDARSRLDDVRQRISAEQTELKARIEQLTAAIAAAEEGAPDLEGTKQRLKAANERSVVLTAADARLAASVAAHDALRALLVKADDNSGLTALTKILRAEKVAAIAANAFWLWLKVATAGGGQQTLRWLWGIFPTIRFSGGAVAEFMLFDTAGNVVKAAVLPGYTGFLKLQDREQTTAALANVPV